MTTERERIAEALAEAWDRGTTHGYKHGGRSDVLAWAKVTAAALLRAEPVGERQDISLWHHGAEVYRGPPLTPEQAKAVMAGWEATTLPVRPVGEPVGYAHADDLQDMMEGRSAFAIVEPRSPDDLKGVRLYAAPRAAPEAQEPERPTPMFADYALNIPLVPPVSAAGEEAPATHTGDVEGLVDVLEDAIMRGGKPKHTNAEIRGAWCALRLIIHGLLRARPSEDATVHDQPIEYTADGVIRFRANPIVRDLLDHATPRGMSLNDIVPRDYPQWALEQFYQLIGYSISGYSELSRVSDAAYARAEACAAALAARSQGGGA